MRTITTIGLDIAKSVFKSAALMRMASQLKRRYVLSFFQKLPPCLIGIEACASSHYWSRELQALGHTVRLMPPAYVKPYVNDRRTMPLSQKRFVKRSPDQTCGSWQPRRRSSRAV